MADWKDKLAEKTIGTVRGVGKRVKEWWVKWVLDDAIDLSKKAAQKFYDGGQFMKGVAKATNSVAEYVADYATDEEKEQAESWKGIKLLGNYGLAWIVIKRENARWEIIVDTRIRIEAIQEKIGNTDDPKEKERLTKQAEAAAKGAMAVMYFHELSIADTNERRVEVLIEMAKCGYSGVAEFLIKVFDIDVKESHRSFVDMLFEIDLENLDSFGDSIENPEAQDIPDEEELESDKAENIS